MGGRRSCVEKEARDGDQASYLPVKLCMVLT